jgi:hypothetical protein
MDKALALSSGLWPQLSVRGDFRMAISWLAALKVVPWGKVMEHAPQVLDKARGLIDKHRSGAPAAQPAPSSPDLGDVPSLGELKNRCLALQAQCEQLAQAQQQMAQTLAELAEQNAGLIGMVSRLQSRLRALLIWGSLLVLVAGALALWWLRAWP